LKQFGGGGSAVVCLQADFIRDKLVDEFLTDEFTCRRVINHSIDNADGIVDPVNATLIGSNPMLVLCPLEKGFCADVMLLGNKAERPLPIRIPVFNTARKSLSFN
jgi:hypothetical protein